VQGWVPFSVGRWVPFAVGRHGLVIVPGDNAGAGLLADFAASGDGARQLVDFVDGCSATFNVFGDFGIPDANMCSEDDTYGLTGNNADSKDWERGEGRDREVDIRVDMDKARGMAEEIEPDRLISATLGHELIHAALLCESMESNPDVSVLEGGGIPLVSDVFTTSYVLEELME
jgi:hypothetical protein